METPPSGRATPTIIQTPATSSAESDSDQLDKPVNTSAKTLETESESAEARPLLSSIRTLATSSAESDSDQLDKPVKPVKTSAKTCEPESESAEASPLLSSIIKTPATSAAESDQLDKPVRTSAKTLETESESAGARPSIPKVSSIESSTPPLSSIPKAVSIETSTPSKEFSPDGPTSCSTPTLSTDSRDKEGSLSTPSRHLDLDLEGSVASQLTIEGSMASQLTIASSHQTYHSAVTFAEPEIRAPIVGYEIMEQRAKFTVFRIHVQFSEIDSWFIFRRYTDFVRLNDRLREKYPTFRLALPPKRWFGSNFDPNFLEDRQLGLQAFINNVTGHKDIAQSNAVRDFLCLDDPPGAHDSLEESRALCESLEESVYNLRKDLAERETQLAQTRMEFAEARHKITAIMSQAEKAGLQISIPEFNSSTPSVDSDNSGLDFHSCIEADQVVRPRQQFRQEERTRQSDSDTITLSQEKSYFSSPNCNINNSTDFSVHSLVNQTSLNGSSRIGPSGDDNSAKQKVISTTLSFT